MALPADLKTWVAENPEVGEWLTSVVDRTKPMYGRRFKNFYDWLTAKPEFEGMSPAQLLDHQDQATGRQRARIANQLSVYIGELASEYRPKTLSDYYSSTRSFFNYHGCELPKRKFSLPENYHRRAPQDLDRAKVVRILQVAKIRDRAIYCMCGMAALGFREFNIVNREKWADIKRQLDEGKDRLILYLPARKNNRIRGQDYPVVIGRDAVQLLKDYLKKRGDPNDDGQPIFLRESTAGRGVTDEGVKARPFRKSFENLARRAQLIEGKGTDRTARYGISPHQLRDVFRSEWQRSGADPLVAEHLMGHSTDPNLYLKFTPEFILEQYEIAEPRLSFISSPDMTLVPIDEVETLRAVVKGLQEELAEVSSNGIQLRVAEQQRMIDEMQKSLEAINRRDEERRDWEKQRGG